MQDPKILCQMKNVIKNSTAPKNAFAKFSKAILKKEKQKMVKGGSGDSIIVEDLLVG